MIFKIFKRALLRYKLIPLKFTYNSMVLIWSQICATIITAVF